MGVKLTVTAEALNSPPKTEKSKAHKGRNIPLNLNCTPPCVFCGCLGRPVATAGCDDGLEVAGEFRKVRTSIKPRGRFPTPCSLSRPYPRERAYRGGLFDAVGQGTILMSDVLWRTISLLPTCPRLKSPCRNLALRRNRMVPSARCSARTA